MTRRLYLTLALVVFVAASVRGDVTLAPLFRDGAVLQRDKPVPVWGKGDPGEVVHVRFGAQSLTTTAGPDGRWSVTLAPLRASATPAELTVSGRNSLRVSDILVGEVWLCSGQSNMNFTVNGARDAATEIAAAHNPLIRYFGTANVGAETPQDTTEGAWKTASPENVGAFSAVAYFFARDLQPRLGIPVGIVKGTPGGSAIEAWMSAATLAADPNAATIADRWKKTVAAYPKVKSNYEGALAQWERAAAAAKAAGEKFTSPRPKAPQPPGERNRPSGLYNSNIHPFIPYAIRGFLWYQGEGNAARPADYRVSFPAMIRQWRSDFRQGDLPFFFVQLANYEPPNEPTGRQWAFQREAQTAALALPQTGMAVTIDIGDPKNIHPTNKQEVGRRLALLARTRVYGEKIPGESPRAVVFERDGAAFRVRFSADDGLKTREDASVDVELAGADRVFRPAAATIQGSTLVVSSPAVPDPAAVRYAWRNNPPAALFNTVGLPFAPFRSDAWSPATNP